MVHLTDSEEPLLRSSIEYNVFTEIIRPELEKLSELQYATKWTDVEISLDRDLQAWKTMTNDEQQFIKYILSFSLVSDQLVNANLLTNFMQEVKDPSAILFYAGQYEIEIIHQRTYSKMFLAVVNDPIERQKYLEPVKNMPAISQKIKWIEKWITADVPFAQRIVAFIICEMIFFSSLFCAFYWLKGQRNSLLPGMIQANEFIARDEGLHGTFGITMLKYVKNKLPQETIVKMFTEAVDIEQEFVYAALEHDIFGMNASQMCQYVESIADNTIKEVLCDTNTTCDIIYNTKNPFPWIEMMDIAVIANTFERESTEYQKAVNETGEQNFSMIEDI